MNKFQSLITAALCAAIFSACNSDNPESPADNNVSYLTIGEVSVESLSRMGLDAQNFEAGDVIGLFIRNSSDNSYGTDCDNIPVTFDGTRWTMKTKIPITSTNQAYVNAYYPYNENISADRSNKSYFDDSETIYKDLMTAYCVPGTDAKINLSFQRQMIRINLNIKLGSAYTGEGKLNEFKIVPSYYCNYLSDFRVYSHLGPTCDIRYIHSADNILIQQSFSDGIVLSNTNKTFTYLISKLHSDNVYRPYQMTLYLTIDGLNYKAGTFDCSEWQPGYEYNINVNFNVKNAVVTTSMSPWQEGEIYNSNLE